METMKPEENEVVNFNNPSDNNMEVQTKETPKSAKALRRIAGIGLIAGVVLTLIFFAMTAGGAFREKVLIPLFLLCAALFLFLVFVFWAFFNALADIVDNTAKIARNTEKK